MFVSCFGKEKESNKLLLNGPTVGKGFNYGRRGDGLPSMEFAKRCGRWGHISRSVTC